MKILQLKNFIWAAVDGFQRVKTVCGSTLSRNFATKEPPNSAEKKYVLNYGDTIITPSTRFPFKIPYSQRKENEHRLAEIVNPDSMHGLQRLWRRDSQEYIIHDGPPYANGEAHLGHAVNKIMKDITARYKMLQGYRIHFVPGWDCHGLPIELKTLKGMKSVPSGAEIRKSARAVANDAMASQMAAFRRWGVMADWKGPYRTFDSTYVKTQLRLFKELYDKNYVYQALKPVYWSPSNHTALAEAELEYNPEHRSTAVFLAMELVLNVKEFSEIVPHWRVSPPSGPIKAAIWTTTPWTIPGNKAIAYKVGEMYSVVFKTDSDSTHRNYYIVSSKLVPAFEAAIGTSFSIAAEFPGELLKDLKYRHPWFSEETCPFLNSEDVTMDKGTGLVHIAPAHGHEDYVLGLKNGLEVDCFVDNNGNFDARLGHLKGLSVLTEGNIEVMLKLEPNILKREKIIHSYPYDWRSKKPVIIKTSNQWFMDTEKIKPQAIESLKEVNVYPKHFALGLHNQLLSRPYWCISRQRVWGVPIPVLYHRETREPLVNDLVIDRLCSILDEDGDIDKWWSVPASTLLEGFDGAENYEKGNDIFDIWLDSGISWHTLEGKIADLCIEGQDQLTGWFQSSLLMSAALRAKAPYKNLLVHGFVVDKENKKMSKSVGNVVSPYDITDGNEKFKIEAFGADTLRWWVATQGSADGSNILFSNSFLRTADQNVQKLRQVFRFLLGYLSHKNSDGGILEREYAELEHVDQYMLLLVMDFEKQILDYYEKFEYHKVMMRTLQFATTEVSAHYLTWIKDRLYCEEAERESRKSALFVMREVYLALMKAIAPVLPFLAEESYQSYSEVGESFFQYDWFKMGNLDLEDDPDIRKLFELALTIRKSVNEIIGENDRQQVHVEIRCNAANRILLQNLCADENSSDFCDMLQVAIVVVEEDKETGFTIDHYGVAHGDGYSVAVGQAARSKCHRCRRFCCSEGEAVCPRCVLVLQSRERGQAEKTYANLHVEKPMEGNEIRERDIKPRSQL